MDRYIPAEDATLQPREPRTPDPMLVRGMRVTWWYTFWGIVFFELVFLFLAATLYSFGAPSTLGAVVLLAGGAIWLIGTVVLMNEYRQGSITGDEPSRARLWVVLGLAGAFGVALSLTTGLWSVAVMPLAQAVVLLQWPPSVRSRVSLGVTALLIVLAVLDGVAQAGTESYRDGAFGWWFSSIYICFTPVMTVFSLWWWDVVVRLDHARAAEGRLAATQERLRVATDVHDLQGHHLQVIALQLELAERLMEHDPAAALEQLGEARRSVDAARQGTRDLAKPFRGVPLPDEMENAADLLRAAGAKVTISVDPASVTAPVAVLGPVIRETTTNVLKHGGGVWVHTSLQRDGNLWRYRIANDSAAVGADDGFGERQGTGLDGVRRRVREVGGSLEVSHTGEEFAVTIEVPVGATESPVDSGEGVQR